MARYKSAGEAVARTLALTIFLFLLFSCGVKVAPASVARTNAVIAPNVQCETTDPECDKTDPAYRPQGRP
ncbi:MAG: hypothetical protein EOP11_05495 [Proteobacteria bacterium]|nr:MAG: hypothetical protein EOP11_05495 [Pseudomonadota bacterium]